MSLSKKVVLTVSGYKISLSDSLQFYQNDQLKLIFEINKYGIDVASSFTHKTLMPLQPLTATLFIETPLGVDSIESANIEDNAVTFYLTSNQTQHIGTSTMQIKLTDDDGCQITLPSFTFEVQKNIYDNAVHVSGILLADENGNVLSDENGNTVNATATTESSKQIKDFSLKTGVSGQEDILVQDNGVTKRIKSSELIDTVDLTGYATETFVTNKIAEASLGGEIDLSGYATKADLNNKANVSHTHTKSDITDLSIPTKTSQLTNDSGFITSVPSEYVTESELSTKHYATETYVQNKIAEASLSGGEVDLSGYATKDDLNTKANITYVDNELAKKANASHIHSYNDLTDKPTIPSVPTKVSQLTNDKGYLTSVPSEYITDTELTAKGYATSTDLTNGLNTKSDTTHNHDAVYAKTKHTHSEYLTEHQDISMKADKTELHSHSNKTVLDEITSTKVTEWNNKSNFDGNYNSLTNKPTIPTVDVNKSYVDTQLANKSDTTHNHDTVYSKLDHNHTGMLTSNSITRIEVVDALPGQQENGVLYIVKGE